MGSEGERKLGGYKKFILRSMGKKCLIPKMVEYENGKFNQNEGNFKTKVQMLKSLRMFRVPPAQRNAYFPAKKSTFNCMW